MNNVIEFPKRADKSWSERSGELNINSFKELNRAGAITVHPLLYVVSTLIKSKYLEHLKVSDWGFSEFDIEISNTDSTSFFQTRSTVRADLCPEFGCQIHTQYLRVSCRENIGDVKTENIPNYLLQHLAVYYGQFPNVSPAQKVSFNYAVLAALIDYPSIRYVTHGVEDGKFVVHFLVPGEDSRSLYLTYTADFLPILLDGAAFQHHIENNPTDEDK